MSFNIIISKRDFSTALSQPNLAYQVTRHSWDAIGGPDQAEITATGEDMGLWSLMNKLRCPIEIQNKDNGEFVWWGYVSKVLIQSAGAQVGVSLDEMYNRIAVAYSYVEGGSNTAGERKTTGWIEDTDSSAEYGEKELLQSLGSGSTLASIHRRDTLLDQRKYPVPMVDWRGMTGETKAVISCRGWWHSLGWTYYTQNAGLENHEDYDSTQDVGAAGANTKVEMSFELTSGVAWTAQNIKLHIKKVGTPAGVVWAKIFSDSGGDPDSELAWGLVGEADVDTTSAWLTFNFDSNVALSLSTTYHLVIEKYGANDASNYYVVSVDEALGYTNGALQLYDGASWGARGTDADLAFRVGGIQETTTQIETAIDDEGQFISSVTLDDTSGVYSSQYRDGDTTTLTEVEELLKDGTTNDKRLLATVKRDRRLVVSEEPATSSLDYLLERDGVLTNHLGVKERPATCRVGVWAELKDVIPITLGTSLANPSPMFIDHAEFSGQTGRTRYTPRGIPQPWDLMKMFTT